MREMRLHLPPTALAAHPGFHFGHLGCAYSAFFHNDERFDDSGSRAGPISAGIPAVYPGEIGCRAESRGCSPGDAPDAGPVGLNLPDSFLLLKPKGPPETQKTIRDQTQTVSTPRHIHAKVKTPGR